MNINKIFDTTIKEHYYLFINQLKEWGNDNDYIENVLDEQFFKDLPYWTCGDAFYIAKMYGFDAILIQEELDKEILSIAVFDKENIEIINIQ